VGSVGLLADRLQPKCVDVLYCERLGRFGSPFDAAAGGFRRALGALAARDVNTASAPSVLLEKSGLGSKEKPENLG
jgi:hypothetical protein